jgi:hypothetical protein
VQALSQNRLRAFAQWQEDQESMKDFLFMIAVVIVLTLLLGGLILLISMLPLFNQPCSFPASFACRNLQVQRCVESELYTREECIALVGGGGGAK